MLLSIRYSLLSSPTSLLLTFIGKDQKLGNAKHIPARNYDDVLDAWESLFKTKSLNGQQCSSAELYKGGKWSGKHVLSAPPDILEKINSWDRTKSANTPSREVLGEFYDDQVMAQTSVPEVVDDLGLSNEPSYTEKLPDSPLQEAIKNDEIVEVKPKVKKKKKEDAIA